MTYLKYVALFLNICGFSRYICDAEFYFKSVVVREHILLNLNPFKCSQTWPNIRSILVNVPWAYKKNVYSSDIRCNVLYIQIG